MTRVRAEAAARAEQGTRGDRRRERTRARLLDGARRAMSDKGVDGVTIAEITEAADVAFGSFYNHFASKDEIFDTLILQMLDRLGTFIDDAIVDIEDPVEALAVAFTLLQRTTTDDDEWTAFMFRAVAADDRLLDGILARTERDVKRAIDAGQLLVPDLDTALAMIAGATLFANRARLTHRIEPGSATHAVAIVLQMLGVAATEAIAGADRAAARVDRDGLRGDGLSLDSSVDASTLDGSSLHRSVLAS